MTDLIAVHRRVVEASVAVVGHVTVADLGAATPCAGWAVRDLLAHMIGQHYGFAAAVSGAGRDPAEYAPRPVGAEPAAEYAASARHVLAAFARPGLLDEQVFLAEVRGGLTVPTATAVGFHLVDYVVHGWDVARSIGVPADYDDEALAVALSVALAVPDEPRSTDGSTAFAPAVPTTSTATLDRVVAVLGRDPGWPATGSR